jgi:hypothetical protein
MPGGPRGECRPDEHATQIEHETESGRPGIVTILAFVLPLHQLVGGQPSSTIVLSRARREGQPPHRPD